MASSLVKRSGVIRQEEKEGKKNAFGGDVDGGGERERESGGDDDKTQRERQRRREMKR